MKFAYFAFPHLGGTYSVFRNLRQGFEGTPDEIRWLSAGAQPHSFAKDAYFQSQLEHGSLVGQPADDDRAQAKSLLRAIDQQAFDGVFVNVYADRVQSNIARYLPDDVLRVMIVHNITPATYAAAASLRDHVHATVAVSRRIGDDLVARHGFVPQRVRVIPNGVDFKTPWSQRLRSDSQQLRVLFLGRIEDQAKGVFWLPAIMDALKPGTRLTIAGDGPDLPELKKRMARFGTSVDFRGSVAPDRVPFLLAAHDVFLMPSRYEGFPVALVEAMAAGCVPVASHLAGVTDMAVQHGQNGYLFPVGNPVAAALAINQLADDPALRDHFSARASRTVTEHFGIPQASRAYRDILESLEASPPRIARPLNLADWHYPAGLKRGFRTYLPTPLKNALRQWRERASAGIATPTVPTGVRR
jgi:glycosyltransferase involved in cell wall biosynthesis